jgi:hypothetical protein
MTKNFNFEAKKILFIIAGREWQPGEKYRLGFKN